MPSSKGITVLGIDPGLAKTGYGIIRYQDNRATLIDYGAIITGAKEPNGRRLQKIYSSIKRLIIRYNPDSVGVELLFFAKNAKTAFAVGHARGVALLAAYERKASIREFTPLQVKQALTGYGMASKVQIQKMVQQQLNMKTLPKPYDAADALAIAICCAQTKIFK